MLKKIRNYLVEKIASRHVAGKEIDDALRVCHWGQSEGYNSIISYWADNEGGINDSNNKGQVLEYFKSNITAVEEENITSCYVSIKLDAIGYDYDLLEDLLRIAEKYNVGIHVDSLNPASVPRTFQFFERASAFSQSLGCTLPSRWQRSLIDAERAVDLGLAVRVVKGQWKDPDNEKVDSRKNFLAIIRKLAGKTRYIGVATHDLPLAQEALSLLSDTGTYCELEQFFSLPLKGKEIAEQLDLPYRIYVAYGNPAIPYNYRFSLTRPSLAAWMLSDLFFKRARPWAKM